MRELDDDVLLSGALPNLYVAAFTRTNPVPGSIFTAATIDNNLTLQVGPDWESLTTYSAQDIADAANAGNHDLLWEVVCAGRTSGGGSQQAFFLVAARA